MKLKEYIEELNKFVQEYPESLELPVIYSKDDEGNAYHNVIYSPTMCQVHDIDEYYLHVFYINSIKTDITKSKIWI